MFQINCLSTHSTGQLNTPDNTTLIHTVVPGTEDSFEDLHLYIYHQTYLQSTYLVPENTAIKNFNNGDSDSDKFSVELCNPLNCSIYQKYNMFSSTTDCKL